ncbi:hypothetical protein U8527_00660 [Kordia algicida OT-1]|uniref:Uncharacterized protein n=1 Tax=Kordia algicida OT-1 TaxID=391587 RepID=A9DRJ6_9FLAO|nr:hypothetical protein [Kordia algicida]EDP96803.1 hypothetical protein KAOT1_16608 [Kordia algicida OT-1]
MHAYEYGITKFNKKYQPAPNITVFNDRLVFIDKDGSEQEDQSTPEAFSIFSYIEVSHTGENTFSYDLENRKRVNASLMEDYLIPNNHVTITNDNTLTNIPVYTDSVEPDYYQDATNVTIHSYEGRHYIKHNFASYGGVESVIVAKSTRPKLFTLKDEKLKELLNNPEISLIFFFSKDGAKLEGAHLSIDDVKDNEIIFFLEKDDSYNIFGSVARVLSGKNINSLSQMPYTATANLANVFKVDTEPEQIKKVCKGHLEAKQTNQEKGFFYYLGQAVDFVAKLTAKFFKVTQGDPLIYIGEAISENLRFDEKRWRYFDEEGKPSKNFEPIIPGFLHFLEIADVIHENIEKNSENFKSKLAGIEDRIDEFLDIVPIRSIRRYLKKKLKILFDVIEKMRDVYDTVIKIITSKEIFLFANALLIGLLNSLSAAVGGILTLIGHIMNLPYYLYKASETKSERKSGYISMVIELLENGIEAFISLFSVKNLAAIASFFIEAPGLVRDFLTSPSTIMTKTTEAGSYVKTHSDAIGYGMGYAIGFVVEEVLTTMATMGTANVVKAVKVTVDSFKSILIASGKAAKFTITSPKTLVKGMSLLFKRMRKLNVPKLLDELLAFLKSLLTTARQLAEEAFDKAFKHNPLVKVQLQRAGYAPTEVIDDLIRICPIKA